MTREVIPQLVRDVAKLKRGTYPGAGISDVVHVGASAPSNPLVELWWDSDEPAVTVAPLPWVDVCDHGAVGDGVTDDSAAIQSVLDDAGDLLTPLQNPGAFVVFPPGTYNIGTTGLTARCSIWMMPGASLMYSGTGIALLIDDIDDVYVDAFVRRATTTWDDGIDTSSIGISFRNCNSPRGSVHAIGFFVGLEYHGDEAGSSYGVMDIRDILDCQIGLRFRKTGVGFANQHEFRGRIRLSSSVAAGIAGTRAIDLSTTGNGSTFVGMSLEGNRYEYTVDCSVPYASFVNCRWEQASGIRLNTGAIAHFVGGYQMEGIGSGGGVPIIDNGGDAVIIGSHSGQFRVDGGATGTGQGYIFQGVNSGTNIVLTTMGNTGLTFGELQANGNYSVYRASGKGDASFPSPSVIVDGTNRRVWFGDGTATPVQYIQGTSQTRVDVQATIFRTLAALEIDGTLDHDGTLAGFYGVAPTARPSAYTQTYSTANKTLAAYTADDESAAYTGAADSEAKLADLNALRVAYENLRAFTEDAVQMLNSVVDDLQALGLLQ